MHPLEIDLDQSIRANLSNKITGMANQNKAKLNEMEAETEEVPNENCEFFDKGI